jgi:nitrite reductase/ring-hydroxylating ferredoxin subunit
MSDWHDVGSLADLERDGRLLARVGGREIGVVVVDGELRGVRNRCPHHGGPLCLGMVVPRFGGEPGRYDLAGTHVLRCPWHGWEFDPRTGVCLDEPSMRVAVYPAEVSDGRVRVQA